MTKGAGVAAIEVRVRETTHQVVYGLGALAGAGAGQEARGEAGGGGRRAGGGGAAVAAAAAGSAERTAGGGGAAACRVLRPEGEVTPCKGVIPPGNSHLGVSFTSLLPPLGTSLFAGVCLVGAIFGWGRFSGLRLTFSTCG